MSQETKTVKLNTFLKNGKSRFSISPSFVKRDWMDMTDNFAYKCLPLNIANQYGWDVICPEDVEADWTGENTVESTTTNSDFFHSVFGYGIITVGLDFIVQTPENISTYVRGPHNKYKENMFFLDGIVETDWLPFTFTMNYKIINPGKVSFKKGETLFTMFFVERNFLENFQLEFSPIDKNVELFEKFKVYNKSRTDLLKSEDPKWQKFYIQGKNVDEKISIKNHTVNLKLKEIINYEY